MNPSVGVVIPTRGHRPDTLRSAALSALGQDYPGTVEIVIVVDRGDPVRVTDQLAALLDDRSLTAGWEDPPSRRVWVMANRLSPGLPGTRNTGIAALGTDLVAFCDDDDQWLPGKVSAQVAALEAEPDAEFSSCAIEVQYGSRRVPRLARHRSGHPQTSGALAHGDGALLDLPVPARHALGGRERPQRPERRLGSGPARRRPPPDRACGPPLVRVRWGGSAYVTRWADRIAGLQWMLARHPDLAVDPRGAARIYGQLAFHHAALGQRREAGRWAWRAFAARHSEPRAPIALAVATGLVPAQAMLGLLHHRGHGI
ncbi:glycosyltransferase family A protein [Streptosporangium lutulentum]